MTLWLKTGCKYVWNTCVPGFFLESLWNLWSWQVFWLVPGQAPSRWKTVAMWCLNDSVKLTAAGLFRIFTWFPFNPCWRNQNLDKCINNFSIGERKNIFFGKLSCLIFSKSFPKRIFWSKIVMPAECLNWMRKFLQTWQVEWCQRIFVGCKRHLFREPVLLNRRYVKQHRRQSC